MAHILIVDDDAHIREVVSYTLEREGHTVVLANNGREALARVDEGGVDLVVLDVLMPELDGLTVCRQLRARGNLPIIFLSSRAEELDRVLGIELGADDYLVKPFSPRELTVRIAAILRRANPAGAAQRTGGLTHGRLVVDPDSHEARVDGHAVEFTVTELKLLVALLAARGRVLTRGQLIDKARDADTHITERTIDTHIRRIRAKLRPFDIDPIQTVHGLGYKAAAASET